MKELKTRFPEGFVDYEIVYDTTPFIRESVNEVFYTLRDAVILVAIVVLVFLQDWKAMILPMIDVPVSLIGTFAIMAAMGFTLNNLTLFGLVLAIGIVVDDAIVVLENIERQIATGLDARTATLKAMDEITGPVLAITLVLSSVFIPCCFLGGVSGQFFRQFAVTISVSTIISAVNALTMTPSRAVVIFRTEEGEKGGHRREALPWWIFGLAGRDLHVLRGAGFLAGKFDLNAALHGQATAAGLADRGHRECGLHPPRRAGGRGLGVVHHPARQRRAGLLVRRLQPLVRLDDGALWPGRRQDAATERHGPGDLRRAAGHDLLAVPAHAHGLHSAAGQGISPAQRAVAGFRLRGAHATRDGQDRKDPGPSNMPGVEHTVGLSGQSLILNANAPNLGSMYILLKPFDERHDPKLSADAIAKSLKSAATRKCGGRSSRPSARRPSTAWARPAATS